MSPPHRNPSHLTQAMNFQNPIATVDIFTKAQERSHRAGEPCADVGWCVAPACYCGLTGYGKGPVWRSSLGPERQKHLLALLK